MMFVFDVCVMNDVSCVRERGPALAHAYYAHAKMLHMRELLLIQLFNMRRIEHETINPASLM